MRVATPPSLLDAALEAALSQWAELTASQRKSALVLQRRLELTPEQTVRLLLAHPSVLDSSPTLESSLDVLQKTLGLSKEELAKGTPHPDACMAQTAVASTPVSHAHSRARCHLRF
jgi:hypothetical protein